MIQTRYRLSLPSPTAPYNASAFRPQKQQSRLAKTHPSRKLFSSVCCAAVCMSICTTPIALGQDNQNLPGEEPVVYEKYSCKLMLPGEKWRWYEPPDLEKGKGFIGLDGMANVILKIQPTKDDELTDTFARNFEGGVLRATGGKKTGSTKITYQGNPCYEFTVLMSGNPNVETTTRLLVVRGFAYGITISMPSRVTHLVSASDVFEKCFEFTETETIAIEKSQDADSQADSEYEKALETIDRRALWIGLPVLVVGVGILILLRRKRTKA